MSLFCLGAYLFIGLLFTLLFWMALVVGKKSDKENSFLRVSETAFHGD
jgi:hypothetical protein